MKPSPADKNVDYLIYSKTFSIFSFSKDRNKRGCYDLDLVVCAFCFSEVLGEAGRGLSVFKPRTSLCTVPDYCRQLRWYPTALSISRVYVFSKSSCVPALSPCLPPLPVRPTSAAWASLLCTPWVSTCTTQVSLSLRSGSPSPPTSKIILVIYKFTGSPPACRHFQVHLFHTVAQGMPFKPFSNTS